MIEILPDLHLQDSEIQFIFIRSPGPGGQNVNKVATAVQLRFDVLHSPSLTDPLRERLMSLAGKKINTEGELIIKATRFRTQERNKQDAFNRLRELLVRALTPPKPRKRTKPTAASVQRRLKSKKQHGQIKSLRRKKINDF